jgi:C4-type Zn-finger protein
MTGCPRCRSAHTHCRRQWQGFESGNLVWTVWHCERCCFTWRDTEPARSIDNAVREAFSRVDPDRPEQYGQNIPPARVRD